MAGGTVRRMPRIAALLASSPPQRFVGGELATHAFLRYLARHGWQVTVHCQGAPIGYTWDGLRVVPYREGQPLFADVLFTHPDLRLDTRRVADRAGIPLVHYVHNTGEWVRKGLRDTPADLTLFNACATADALDEDGPVMVPEVRGVDTRGHLVARDSIGAVNMAVSKGGMTVMTVAAEMPRQRFLLVQGGHGIQNNLPEQFGNVTILPPLLPSHMPGSFYARLKVLLLLSQQESYGMVGLEAAWSGTPVIASDLPGVREALGDAAVYVRPGDWRGVTDWVTILTSEPRLYAHHQARALQRAREQQHEATVGHQAGHALLEHLVGAV